MATTTEATPTDSSPTSFGRVIGMCVGLVLIVGTLTLAFALPSANMGANEVPIAVVGPPQAADEVAARLDAAQPDGFDVVDAASVDEATEMIEEREVYAAFQVSPEGVDLYTATAASPMVARLVNGVADQIAAGLGQEAGQPGSVPVNVEDVIALPEDDPNGAGLAASAFPMAAGGLIIAALLGLSVRGTGRQLVGGIIAPPAVGATIAAILIYWLGSVEGDYLQVAGAISLGLAASTWAVLGLTKLLGRAGLVLGAVTVMLVGNPLSGLTSAPELLPAPWGEVGQYLTPGAGATLLRSTAFFDGAGGATAAIVLASWLAGGLLLFIIGAVGSRVRSVHADEPEPVAATV